MSRVRLRLRLLLTVVMFVGPSHGGRKYLINSTDEVQRVSLHTSIASSATIFC